MFSEVKIKNFRLFSDFHITDLAQVNLVVGLNNSGKSSLLEAIYLLANQNEPATIFELLTRRGEMIVPPEVQRRGMRRGYQLSHLFFDHHLTYEERIEITGTNIRKLRLDMFLIAGVQQRSLFDPEDVDETLPTDQLILDYGEDKQFFFPVYGDEIVESRPSQFWRRSETPDSLPVHLVTTEYLDYERMAFLWDNITLTEKEANVVKALKILEPAVQRISFTSRRTSNSGILVKLDDPNIRVPLGNLGDGMRRVLAVIASLVNAENGILLVDEIDTGLHHTALEDVWNVVFETAATLNIQVFATTHSWDCVKAFSHALKARASEVGKLFRVEREQQNVHAIAYQAEDLAIAMRQHIEVR